MSSSPEFHWKPLQTAILAVPFFSAAHLHIIYEKLGWPLPEQKLVVPSDETQVMNSNSTSAFLETHLDNEDFCWKKVLTNGLISVGSRYTLVS